MFLLQCVRTFVRLKNTKLVGEKCLSSFFTFFSLLKEEFRPSVSHCRMLFTTNFFTESQIRNIFLLSNLCFRQSDFNLSIPFCNLYQTEWTQLNLSGSVDYANHIVTRVTPFIVEPLNDAKKTFFQIRWRLKTAWKSKSGSFFLFDTRLTSYPFPAKLPQSKTREWHKILHQFTLR